MTTIGVAGDSFMSARQDYPDQHFTQHLAKHYVTNYKTFARSGASNTLIRYQINQLIEDSVDFIFWGSTTADRIEIKAKRAQGHPPNLFDFNYHGLEDVSSLDPRFKEHPSIISNSITSLLEYDVPKIAKNIKGFFVKNYEWRSKADQDAWIIHSTWVTLVKSGIPFVFIPAPDLQITPRLNNLLPMDAKNIINDYPLSPYTWDKTEVTPYHTTKLAQEHGHGDWVQSGRLDKYLK
ncbi:hypothetical protein N9993_01235 [bacterium]|jgi:hypothetical protein|nr:hypothetical protein [bacterium]